MKFKMFVKKSRKMYEVEKIDFKNKVAYMENSSLFTKSFYSFDDIVLIPFTGLYDMHGKEIYDGDIIEYKVRNFVDTIWVKWGKVEFAFLKKNVRQFIRHGKLGQKKIVWQRSTYQGLYKYGSIIGNMYENPELLERE